MRPENGRVLGENVFETDKSLDCVGVGCQRQLSLRNYIHSSRYPTRPQAQDKKQQYIDERNSGVDIVDGSKLRRGGHTVTPSVRNRGEKNIINNMQVETWKEIQALRGTAGPDEPVFRSRNTKKAHNDGALDTRQLGRIVKAAAKRAGLDEDVSPHWMRHAHASHALDRGAPIHLVRDTLGHESAATTSRYLHARPDDSSSRFLPV